MSRHVADLIAAIDRKDADGIRAAYAPGARLVAMTPNTFRVHEGVDAVAAKVAEWYTTWEEAGATWVVRQAHILTSGPQGIEDHRMYCRGPREGQPELAAASVEAGR